MRQKLFEPLSPRCEPGVKRPTSSPALAISHLAPRRGMNHALFDVSVDGRRFLLPEVVGTEGPEPSIRVVQNWYEQFRDREQD